MCILFLICSVHMGLRTFLFCHSSSSKADKEFGEQRALFTSRSLQSYKSRVHEKCTKTLQIKNYIQIHKYVLVCIWCVMYISIIVKKLRSTDSFLLHTSHIGVPFVQEINRLTLKIHNKPTMNTSLKKIVSRQSDHDASPCFAQII
jgi:hypothetical protein